MGPETGPSILIQPSKREPWLMVLHLELHSSRDSRSELLVSVQEYGYTLNHLRDPSII